MKLKATIISLVSVLIIALSAILIYCYWPAIKGTVDGNKYYTAEDLQESYDDGYNDGCKSETELTGQVKYYKELVDEYYIQVNTLNNEIAMYTTKTNDYKTQISDLTNTRDDLELQVNNLTTIKSNNEKTITQLNSQIANLQNEVSRLENDNDNKDTTIEQKDLQIASLQAIASQLQRTNALNNETITSLNNQIASLNSQIADITIQIQNNSSNVTALNNKIAKLEKSVSYYEQYIANLENGEQVVATFEFNGSVYNIQIVNKNNIVSVVDPTSTDYVIFNYWTVNGEQIDLSTYKITTNTKIVADVTYKYEVKFMVESQEYNSQIVIKNDYATMPANPIKDGYEFDGWSLNGVDIVSDINTTAVTNNTNFTAIFTKLHTVTFMYEDAIKETQTVRNGEYSTNITVNSTPYKVFNGWKLNDTIVDITSQKIVADTTFIADITYKYDVEFMVDDTEYNSQIITANNYATIPENPTKTGYEFIGWSLDGSNIVDINGYLIDSDKSFYAVFKRLSGFYEFQFTDLKSYISADFVAGRMWTDGTDVYYSKSTSEHYILDKTTNSWSKIQIGGLSSCNSFSGYYVWHYGSNTYYSCSGDDYRFDKDTKTWTEVVWTGDCGGNVMGDNFWTDNNNRLFYSVDNITWIVDMETMSWSEYDEGNLYILRTGENIWSDGINTYFSSSLSQYIFNCDTNYWVKTTWNNEDVSFLYGYRVYNIGNNIYCFADSEYYVLNKETNTWNSIAYSVDIGGSCHKFIWGDGENYYMLSGGNFYLICA